MPMVRLRAPNGKLKKEFPSNLDPNDKVGADALLEHWGKKLGHRRLTLEVFDRTCKCFRKYRSESRN